MRVVVVDDNDLWRPSLVAALSSRGITVVAEASDGAELLTAIQEEHRPEHPIDVAILDLRLPPTWSDEGIHLARGIRKQFPTIGMILLSGYEKDVQLHYAARALADLGGSGGMGYLFKDRTSRAGLKDAVQRVSDGRLVVDTLFAQEAADEYRSRESQKDEFTEREVAVLELLVQGMTNKEIASKLYVSQAVVERHLTRIFNHVLSGEPTVPDLLRPDATRRENRRVLMVLEWLRRTGRLS